MNTTDLHIPSNKVRDIERYILTELHHLYPEGELRSITRLLFEAFHGWDTTQFLLHRDDTINQSDLLKFHWAVEDLKKYRPVQQIIGHTQFCGCRIDVNQHVLIPRPETEEIVLRTIQILRQTPPDSILDICTGSGCIAIALSHHFPKAETTAIDISEEALLVAQHNAEYNHTPIQFLRDDVFHHTLILHTYDLIISNPPYIPQSERSLMEPNVTDHEPSLALFVPDSDPLCFYRSIAELAVQHLSLTGHLVLEIHEHYGNDVLVLMQQMGFEATLYPDFRDKDRMIIAQKTNSTTA